MKKLLLSALATLVVLLAAVATPASADHGAALRRASHAGSSLSATAVQAMGASYTNACVTQAVAEGWKGRVNLTNPVGNPSVLMQLSLTKAAANATYTVWRDGDGLPGSGPWTQLGSLTTNGAGAGTWKSTIAETSLTPGTHTWAIGLNGPASCGTTLVTDHNLVFRTYPSR